MKLGIVIAALLATSTMASAGTVDTAARRDPLKGMTLVSDGLYARISPDRESYVATNAAGRKAMAEKMRKVNAVFAEQYAAGGLTRSERIALERSERIQKDLLKPVVQAKVPNSCNSGAALFASVSVADGHSASASAGITLDFGPTTPTENYAWARAGSGSRDDFGIGLDAAEAWYFDPYACISEAIAQVTCPAGDGGEGAYMQDISIDPYSNCQIP
jgi:hypothetical protein